MRNDNNRRHVGWEAPWTWTTLCGKERNGKWPAVVAGPGEEVNCTVCLGLLGVTEFRAGDRPAEVPVDGEKAS